MNVRAFRRRRLRKAVLAMEKRLTVSHPTKNGDGLLSEVRRCVRINEGCVDDRA